MITEQEFDGIVKVMDGFHSDYNFYNSDSYQDNYIDGELIYIDTMELTKRGYTQYENLVKNSSLETKNMQVYCSNDCSSYEYWTNIQEESNYLHIVISFKEDSTTVTMDEMDKLYDFMEKVSNKYCYIKEKHKRKGA